MIPIRLPLIFSAALSLLGILHLAAQSSPDDAPATTGATIHYQLPTDGPLPKTYRVTLAAVDPQEPGWVISEFASGVVRTVTAENQGKFTETWNGLDENYMPVPPGTYALKGIYMPAEKWAIDGLYHTITPKLVAMGGSWGQSPAQDSLPGKVEGDPVGGPLRDVDIAANGKGSVYFQYLENGKNYFLTDFTKPNDYDQIITGYTSGVFAGGNSTCTDGDVIWSFSTDGGPKFVGRADGKPFGHQNANRHNVFLPEGWVTALAAWPSKDLGHTVVFVSEGGRIVHDPVKKWRYDENPADRVDQVLALDGNDAGVMATWKIDHPLGLAARNNKLLILHGTAGNYEVLAVPLEKGWESSQPSLLFKVPANITPFDIEADSHGRIYLSDSGANHVYQFDAQGKPLRTYGRLDRQKGGTFDRESFMAPEKLATWTDDKGRDRLLVVEMAGPNRLSEWSGDDGTLIREWVTPQTKANDGYAVDPRHPDTVYMLGQRETLVRWKINYDTGAWTTDAVWENVGVKSLEGKFGERLVLTRPRVLYHGDDRYIAFTSAGCHFIYREEGDRWRNCTGFLRIKGGDKPSVYIWRDLNGDGLVQDEEYLPFQTTLPPATVYSRAFGDTWTNNFDFIAMGRGNTSDIWELSPTSFDKLGNPIFDPNGWKKLLSDPTFVAKKAGTATATHGGNEVGDSFGSDWATTYPMPNGDVYVSARSGPNFTANYGAQYKLSRYIPDGKGGFTQKWRVGRMALRENADPGQVYGPIFLSPPINGLIGVVDNSRAGFVIYTEEGLYVDTLFPDAHTVSHDQMGAYWIPGEYFTGYDYLDKDNGKVYMALGKVMPEIYEAKGWTATENPVKPLTTLDKSVTLSVGQIASPPEIALTVRGGAAAARIARFYPAPGGGPALDGSMNGWDACDPVQFSSGPDQKIEARCYYDPQHLFIRWHARLGHDFAAKPLGLPQHIFAHDRGNDTLGLYLQGDANAPAGGKSPGGRAGDVRFVFGLFKDGDAIKPTVVGMYPQWTGSNPSAQTYTTPVGSVSFGNVAVVPGVNAGYKIDDDGKGFTLAAAIPRAAIPGAPAFDGWRTQGNFDANLGGVDRFWWSDADGSASRETFDEPTEARLYPGSWSTLQFLPMTSLPIRNWMVVGPFGFADLPKMDHGAQRPEIATRLAATAYPPEASRDMTATYEGGLTQIRSKQYKDSWKETALSIDAIELKKVIDWADWEEEGTVYILTHIKSPVAATVDLQMLDMRGQVSMRGWLNGQPFAQPLFDWQKKAGASSKASLALQPGWNEVLIRCDYIFGDKEGLGARLIAPPDVLWGLKISGPPPTP